MKFHALLPILLLFTLCQSCNANLLSPRGKIEAKVTLLPGSTDLDFWFHTPGFSGVDINTVSEVFLGQKFTIAVVLYKKEFTAGEPLDLEYTIRAIAPDGKVTMIADKQPFLVPSYDGSVLLLPTVHSCSLLSNADLGKHVFKVEIRDKATKHVTRASAKLVAKTWSWPSGETDLGNLQKYYTTTDPSTLHQLAFSPKLKVERWIETGKINLPIFSLLMFGYDRHDFLLEDYRERFPSCTPFERRRILFLVTLVGGEPIGDNLLTEEEKAWIAKLVQLHLPNPYQALKTTDDLDFLWGEFLATGAYAPIRRMTDALQFGNDAKLVDKFLEEKTQPETDADKAAYDRGVLFKKTVWALCKYGQDHDLAFNYLLWALKNEPLSPDIRNEISRINAVILAKVLINEFIIGKGDIIILINPPEDSSGQNK
jgi:hypothetical protein